MAKFQKNESEYLRCLDRSAEFYLAARLLWFEEIMPPFTFCTFQAVETAIKGACFYFDSSFDPKAFNHDLEKLLAHLISLSPCASKIKIPSHWNQRWQEASRYADNGFGFNKFELHSLDEIFAKTVMSVPFQFTNSELYHLLNDSKFTRKQEIFQRENKQFMALREFVSKHSKAP